MKRIIALLLALSLMLGCAALGEDAKKKIIVGTNAEFAPFEYFNDDGVIDGFDADLMDMIMTLLGYEYEIVSMDFDSLLPALASGQIDLAIAAMTIDETRKENALFSDPYFDASQKIVVPVGSDILDETGLNGKKIGVQLGTTGDIYATEIAPDATIERYAKALDAIIDLANGRLDAVVTDAEPAKAYAAPYDNIVVLDKILSDESYGIAAALESTELIAEVNAALAAIFELGYYDELYLYWFGEEEDVPEDEV